MAQLWLYGEPGERGAQKRSWAGFYQNAAEADRAAAERASAINADMLVRQRQLDAIAAARDFANQVDLARYGVERAEDRRRFDVNTKLAENQINATGGVRRDALKQRQMEQQDALLAADRFASFQAPQVAEAGKAIATAQADYNDAQRKLTTMRAEIQNSLPPTVVFDPRRFQFVANPRIAPLPTDIPKIQTANEKLAELKADLDEAGNNLKFHSQTFSDLRREAMANGLTVGVEGGRGVLLNPFTGKKYTVAETQAMTAPAPALPQSEVNPNWKSLPLFAPVDAPAAPLDLSRFASTVTATEPLAPTTTAPAAVMSTAPVVQRRTLSPARFGSSASVTPERRAALIAEANAAIARGADPAMVSQRLREKYGIIVE